MKQLLREAEENPTRATWSPDSEFTQEILKSIGMAAEEYAQKKSEGDRVSVFKTPEDSKFLGKWVSGSLRDDAIYLQYACANLFGSSANRLDKVEKHFSDEDHREVRSDEYDDFDFGTPKQRDPNTPEHKEAREYAEATYANTHRSFEERGITHVTLYRGVETKGQVGVKANERVATKALPLSSWSAAAPKAFHFGDILVSRTFDVRDIFSSCVDKLSADEFEFIVHTPDVGFEAKVENVRARHI